MVIDSSAIVAILAHEPERDDFLALIADAPIRRISATSTVELTIVLSNRKVDDKTTRIDTLLSMLDVVVEPVTTDHALLARAAFLAFGKGRHPAKLNFGDTFSYALAKATGEPLLFKGNDFSRTDVTPAV